jgi:hypothetical protein
LERRLRIRTTVTGRIAGLWHNRLRDFRIIPVYCKVIS